MSDPRSVDGQLIKDAVAELIADSTHPNEQAQRLTQKLVELERRVATTLAGSTSADTGVPPLQQSTHCADRLKLD